jgi:hypothetical protein
VVTRRSRRSGPAIDRLYPPPLHWRPYMSTADLAPLGSSRMLRDVLAAASGSGLSVRIPS